jgi:tellurite resistance protein TehA-like permease
VSWGFGFVLTMVLMLVFSDPAVRGANGELTSTSPSWIFPLVWTPYFMAQAIVRGWRTPDRGANTA